MSNEDACKHEVYMISVLGRKDIGTGILRNHTDGGEYGRLGSLVSEETREKIAAANRNRKQSEETKEKISTALTGRKRGAEFSATMKKAMTGRELSETTKEKMRENNTKDGNPNWKGGLWSGKSHAEYMREWRKRKKLRAT